MAELSGLLGDLVKEVPNMAAIIVVVWVFVRYLGRRDEFAREDRQLTRESIDGLKEVMKDTHQTMGATQSTMHDAKEALHRSADTNKEVIRLLTATNGKAGR